VGDRCSERCAEGLGKVSDAREPEGKTHKDNNSEGKQRHPEVLEGAENNKKPTEGRSADESAEQAWTAFLSIPGSQPAKEFKLLRERTTKVPRGLRKSLVPQSGIGPEGERSGDRGARLLRLPLPGQLLQNHLGNSPQGARQDKAVLRFLRRGAALN